MIIKLAASECKQCTRKGQAGRQSSPKHTVQTVQREREKEVKERSKSTVPAVWHTHSTKSDTVVASLPKYTHTKNCLLVCVCVFTTLWTFWRQSVSKETRESIKKRKEKKQTVKKKKIKKWFNKWDRQSHKKESRGVEVNKGHYRHYQHKSANLAPKKDFLLNYCRTDRQTQNKPAQTERASIILRRPPLSCFPFHFMAALNCTVQYCSVCIGGKPAIPFLSSHCHCRPLLLTDRLTDRK